MSESSKTPATDRDVTISGGSDGMPKHPAKETRSVTRQFKEAEIEVLQKQVALKEQLLQQQTAMLREQREAFEREREDSHRDLEMIKTGLIDREAELSKRAGSQVEHAPRIEESAKIPDELIRMLADLSAEVKNIKLVMNQGTSPPVAASNPQYLDASTSAYFPQPRQQWYESPPPRVNFRDALDSVPIFDGHNISLSQFTRACRRARETFPSASEFDLTRLLLNKLRGRAYYAVEDEPCDSVTQLIDLLNCAFGSPRTIDQYRGELSSIYIKQNEHMLDYIARVKDLRTTILDAERRERGTLNDNAIREIDGLTARAFCDGLPLEFRLQLSPNHHVMPFEAFSHVKVLAKRRDIDKERYESSRGTPRERASYDMHPVGRPLAHSTPLRTDTRRDREPPRPTDPYADRGYAQRYNYPRPNVYPRPRPPIERYREEQARNAHFPAGNPSYRTTNERVRERNAPVCAYCKNVGHTIDECRKKRYNDNVAKSGNANHPSRTTDEPRAGTSREESRPIKTIQATNPESESRS